MQPTALSTSKRLVMVHDGVCPELAVVGPGSAGANPDHGGVMVTVGVQINVECQIRLRDPLALHHHLLAGLYGVAELCLGHPPPEVPDAESVEVDHHLIHILGPELALRLLPQWRVGEALVQQNDATNVECVV